jgi:TPR repeat protein
MKLSIRLFMAAFAIATSSTSALADALEEGIAAYRNKDYAKAAELWRPLADKGIAPAQYQLGTLYAEGKGVEQNDAIAALWFERAANQGDAAAQYNLGASYIEGLGVKKDEAEAAKWFRKAADQRMAFAQLNLGMLYASGRGVPQDNVEALKWIELAVLGMPPGGPRSDAARALKDIADKMTVEQVMEAKGRARTWRPEAEPK